MKSDHPYSSNSPDADPIVDHATAALRDLAIPEGPSPLLLAQTRQALRQSDASTRGGRSIFPYSAILRMAAGVAILCGAAIVYHAIFHHSNVVTVQVEPSRELPRTVSPIVNPPPHIQPPAPVPVASNSKPELPVATTLPQGVIAGRVIFAGVAPPPIPLPGVNLMPECEKMHGGPIYDESLAVNSDGGLANVVVSVSSGLSGWLREEFPPPTEPAVLNQKGCVFVPHVVAIMVGAPLLIKNSDPTLHNVHIMAVNNPQANLGQPTIGETATGPFESPEVFRVKCDVHPWMQAWVRVVDNPFFAVTGRDGRFTLHGLPPGTYTLKAWHEQLGVREMQVTISAGQGMAADFTFAPMTGN